MARRVSLPAADDLFRPTAPVADDVQPEPAVGKPQARSTSSVRVVPDAPEEPIADEAGKKAASGRIRHDEKMTVYVTSAELMDIEQARLTLRGRHGLAVDRGRLVREAIALVLHDLDELGEDSPLLRRLREA